MEIAGVETAATIFVIDDDEAVRDSIRTLLGAVGFTTVGFSDANDYLCDGAPRSCDCIVLDVEMPELSGIDLLDRMRGNGMETPVILMTGTPSEVARQAAERTGAMLLEKPFKGAQLLACVELAVTPVTKQ